MFPSLISVTRLTIPIHELSLCLQRTIHIVSAKKLKVSSNIYVECGVLSLKCSVNANVSCLEQSPTHA